MHNFMRLSTGGASLLQNRPSMLCGVTMVRKIKAPSIQSIMLWADSITSPMGCCYMQLGDLNKFAGD